MIGSLPTPRVLHLMLISCALCLGARPCRAEEKEDIPKRKLVEMAHPVFEKAKSQYSDDRMPLVIERADDQFGKKIEGQKKSRYSLKEAQFVEKAIPLSITCLKKMKDIYATSERGEDRRAKLNAARDEYNAEIQKMVNDQVKAAIQQLQKKGGSQADIDKVKNDGVAMNDMLAMPPVPGPSPTPPADASSSAGVGEPGKTPAENHSGNAGNADAPDPKDEKALGVILFESVHDALGLSRHPSQDHADGNASLPDMIDLIGLPTNNSDPSSMISHAIDQLLKGNFNGALASANRAVDLGGGADALTLRGGIELDQNQFSKANQDAQQALRLDPTNKDALAIGHFSEGRVDGIPSDGPSGVKAAAAGAAGGVGVLGGGYGSGGGASGVSESNSSAASGLSSGLLSRTSGGEAASAAQSALGMNDLGGALAAVNRALAQDPNNPSLLNLRAMIYARQRDYDKAVADAKAGLALAPKNAALLRTLTYAQLRGKQYKDALASANELLELNSKDPYAYALRAHAYGSLGDRDAMMADLQRAADLDSRFAPAAAMMAGRVQLPSDQDILFLFPGEESAGAKKTAPASGRGRNFGLLVGASVFGGLLLALGLLQTVLGPLKEGLASVFTRITRTGPTIGAAVENETAQPAPVNGFVPGLIRDQYEISRQIGAGGMGMVFAGIDRSLGRPVAIKKMRDELRINPQERARFVIEAKTVAALHHPNIVDIYAIAEDGADVYLIFEFVDGRTVHDAVQRAGRLPIADAARVVRAAADALGYAHSRGVIHRDMKPSNMMIGADGRVKVMDFGIARMAKDTMLRRSMTNTVVGTPPYMAPEQEQGHVRKESDVYALAVCAYEMLTGKLPFIGIAAGMLLNKINMSYVAPSRATAGLPAALDEVFAKAFQADPDKRYRTPQEFADALEAALPVAARA